MSVRVVLADDHPIYREGVARSLADADDIEIVGQAEDGDEAARLTEALRPDLVLLDISMPKGGGIAALGRILQMPDPPHVAMLTASEDEADLLQAMRLGALGYILKGVGAVELVGLVRDLAAGQSYVAPGLAGRLLGMMRGVTDGKANLPKATDDPMADLSRREVDILRLVAQGKSNREVGETLDIQEKTVKHYMTSILQKLRVRNRVEAAMLARNHLQS